MKTEPEPNGAEDTDLMRGGAINYLKDLMLTLLLMHVQRHMHTHRNSQVSPFFTFFVCFTRKR